MKEKLQQFITLTVNRREYEIPVGNNRGDMPQSETLAHTLRDRLHLMGLKLGCGQGACGCCTVIMDGRAVTSCMVLTMDCDGSSITTIEGLADPETGDLTGLQQAFVDNCGFQCGFCTPGIIIAVKSLLNKNPNPTEEEIKDALSGNYCRCISHYTVLRAINRVAGNEEDHLAVMHRANDDVENPIPVRQELFLSPYANGTNSDHSLD